MGDGSLMNSPEPRANGSSIPPTDGRLLSTQERSFLQILKENNVLGQSAIATNCPEMVNRARIALAQALAVNSMEAYSSAWTNFTQWCNRHGIDSSKPKEADLTLYVFDKGTKSKDEGGLTYSTIKNYLFGIGHFLA